VGFIALFGVAVLNGIVLISSFNQLRDEGVTDITERILKGTAMRLRPVLMTACVASLGFLPMAISRSTGSEVQRPLATVVLGGLITATILTLLILPALYALLEMPGKKRKGFNTGKTPATVLTSLALPLLIAAGLLFPEGFLKAQSVPHTMSMKQCIDTALQRNPTIKSAVLEKEYYKAGKPASINIPRAELDYTYGQSNSINNDDEFSLRQSIEFPSVYVQQKALAGIEYDASANKLARSRGEIAFQVKRQYFELLCLNSQRKLLKYRDSLYALLERAGERRFRAGETGTMEQMAARAQRIQAAYQLKLNEAETRTGILKLRSLMNYKLPLMPDTAASLSAFYNTAPDTVPNMATPALEWFRQQTEAASKQVSIERSKLYPGISLGYFNKSLIGTQIINGVEQDFTRSDRFSGFMASLSIPVFFGAQASRIKAASLEQKIALQKYEEQKNEFEASYASLLGKYRLDRESLEYYAATAMPHSRLMVLNAGKSIASGEISYIEYLKLIESALQIEGEFIEVQKNYFNTLSTIQLLNGKPE